MTVAYVLAVASAALVFWVFVGYPALLFLCVRPRRGGPEGQLPGVTIIVPTYNEERSIEQKLRNIEALQYPKDHIDILIVDSASKDRTVERARTFPNVRVIVEPEKRGKAHAIRTVLPHARFDIVMITDANAFMAPDVLKKIAPEFDDPAVGGATGSMRQVDRSNTAVSEGGGLYWKMESFMRSRESALHSVIAMSGEVSVFRKSLFFDADGNVLSWYRPGGTDDFEMTLWIIRKGLRVAYVSDAAVWEYAPDTTADLYRQKVRIIVQTIVSVFKNLDLVVRSGAYGLLIFPSRKLLPLFAPFALILVLLGSVILGASNAFWLTTFYLQTVFYLSALLALGPLKRVPLARFALFFVLLNGTVLLAWFDLIRGKDYTSWTPIQSSRKP